MNRKYQKGDYREYVIGLNHRIHHITGAKRSEWPYYEEEWYIEHVWYLDRKREAELMCDSLLDEMFQSRKVNQNIRQAIAEYKRGKKTKALKMYRYEHDGMSIKEAKTELTRLCNG